jgi:hypothetical protein
VPESEVQLYFFFLFLGTEAKSMSTTNLLRDEKNEHLCSLLLKAEIKARWVWLQQINLTN